MRIFLEDENVCAVGHEAKLELFDLKVGSTLQSAGSGSTTSKWLDVPEVEVWYREEALDGDRLGLDLRGFLEHETSWSSGRFEKKLSTRTRITRTTR